MANECNLTFTAPTSPECNLVTSVPILRCTPCPDVDDVLTNHEPILTINGGPPEAIFTYAPPLNYQESFCFNHIGPWPVGALDGAVFGPFGIWDIVAYQIFGTFPMELVYSNDEHKIYKWRKSIEIDCSSAVGKNATNECYTSYFVSPGGSCGGSVSRAYSADCNSAFELETVTFTFGLEKKKLPGLDCLYRYRFYMKINEILIRETIDCRGPITSGFSFFSLQYVIGSFTLGCSIS
jgi:hypothetical protein